MRYFANTADNHAHKLYWILWMECDNKCQMQNSLTLRNLTTQNVTQKIWITKIVACLYIFKNIHLKKNIYPLELHHYEHE